MRAGIERIFRRVKRRPQRCMIKSSSIQTNVSLMNARNMLWVLSDDITVYFERLGLLKRLPLETLRTAAPLSTLRARGRSLSPAAARLIGCLQAAAQEIAEDKLGGLDNLPIGIIFLSSCSPRGAIRRRSNGGAGCGACGRSQARTRAVPGLRPGTLRAPARSWLTRVCR